MFAYLYRLGARFPIRAAEYLGNIFTAWRAGMLAAG